MTCSLRWWAGIRWSDRVIFAGQTAEWVPCVHVESVEKTGRELWHSACHTMPRDVVQAVVNLWGHVHTVCMIPQVTIIACHASLFPRDCFVAYLTGILWSSWSRVRFDIRRTCEDDKTYVQQCMHFPSLHIWEGRKRSQSSQSAVHCYASDTIPP